MNGTKSRLPDSLAHSIDWQAAKIRCFTGRIVIEMLPEDRPTSLYVPDNLRNFFRSTVGVVLASDGRTHMVKGISVESPKPGTMAIVRPDDGIHIQKADLGEYKTANEIRVYGAFAQFVGSPYPMNWWESILAEVTEDMKIRAYGDRIILRKDSTREKSEGGIYLPDGHHEREEMATVLSVGPLLKEEIREGDRVSYNPHYVEKDGVELGARLDFDYCITGPLGINYVVG